VSEDLRYPVGRYVAAAVVSQDDVNDAIGTLAELPGELRNAVDGLSLERLNMPYRPEGWSSRQVIHHLADSHANAFIRVRLALTEEWPTIKAYDEKAWAELHDSTTAPVEWSLELIESLHARWVMLLQSLTAAQWQRGFVHPERGRSTIEAATLLYAWHSRHHLAHITHLRAREKW